MVGDCGDRTLEGPSGSGRGSYSRRSLRPAGGRQRLNLKPEGEALLKLPQRARMVLQSPDTRPWGFGSQVHTPLTPIVRAFHDIDSKDPHPSISNQLILFDL